MQVQKETRGKGISLKTTSVLMVVISVVIAAALVFTGIRAFRSFRAISPSTMFSSPMTGARAIPPNGSSGI